MKSIELTNQELQLLQQELGDILSSKDLTYAQKFLGLDIITEIQPKIDNFYKVQKEIIKDHGTLSEDGASVTWNDEEGGKLYVDLLVTKSDVSYDEAFVDAVINIKSDKIPLVLYKIHKGRKA